MGNPRKLVVKCPPKQKHAQRHTYFTNETNTKRPLKIDPKHQKLSHMLHGIAIFTYIKTINSWYSCGMFIPVPWSKNSRYSVPTTHGHLVDQGSTSLGKVPRPNCDMSMVFRWVLAKAKPTLAAATVNKILAAGFHRDPIGKDGSTYFCPTKIFAWTNIC